MAIGLGGEKRAANLKAFDQKTGNHFSAAPGLCDPQARRTETRADREVAQSSRRHSPSCPPDKHSPGAQLLRLQPWPPGALPAQRSLSPACGFSPASVYPSMWM